MVTREERALSALGNTRTQSFPRCSHLHLRTPLSVWGLDFNMSDLPGLSEVLTFLESRPALGGDESPLLCCCGGLVTLTFYTVSRSLL